MEVGGAKDPEVEVKQHRVERLTFVEVGAEEPVVPGRPPFEPLAEDSIIHSVGIEW